MTAPQVSQVIDENFNGLNTEKANKAETEKKLSELGQKASDLENKKATKAELQAEVTRAINEELKLRTSINNEVLRAKETEEELENNVNSNRYGYNVTVNGLKGGIHTIETAIKDVPSKFRMLGQKITFRTENGDWATYHNESLSLDNYEDVDDWVQEVGISEIQGDVNITNAPDYEDLTEAKNGTIKFADKEYNKDSFSGLGRVYLRKNIVDGVNVLTQDMVSKANTIYIIQYDYDLNGAEITIPEGCVLNFQGGSLSNGIVFFNSTNILGSRSCFKDCILKGDVHANCVNISWFGIKCMSGYDDAIIINQVIQICNKYGVIIIFDHWSDMYVSALFDGEIKEGYDKYFNEIKCLSNTKIIQTSPNWIILQGPTKIGTVICANKGNNASVEGLKIDANNIFHVYYGEDGIAGVKYVKGCHIKNCRKGGHDPNTMNNLVYPNWGYGGKAIQCELNDSEMIVESCTFEDCSFGIFCANQYTDAYQKGIILNVDKCKTISCDVAFMGVALENTVNVNNKYNRISVTDCVFEGTKGEDGIICLAALNCITFDNIIISGKTKNSSFVRGCTQSSVFKNIVLDQPTEAIFDFSATKDNPEIESVSYNTYSFIIKNAFEYLFKNTENVITKYPSYKNNAIYNIFEIICPTFPSSLLFNFGNVDINNSFIDCIFNDWSYRGTYANFSACCVNRITNLPLTDSISFGSDRPTYINGTNYGSVYFDTTLNKPIWWTGEKWVDATGAEV